MRKSNGFSARQLTNSDLHPLLCGVALKLIRQLNREYGITIVMVLHDINQSLYYSDEIVAMKDGKMIAHGLPEEILTSELVREVYDVNLDIRTVDGKPFVIPV